jgi:hypothetical protein
MRAFRSSVYRVYAGRRKFDLAVGRRSFPADRLLQGLDTRSAAFLTAWNPRSKPRSTRRNAAAQQAMLADLRRLGVMALAGEGIGRDRRRPPEESLFALGLDLRTACALGRAYGQDAIVFIEAGRPARLVRLN